MYRLLSQSKARRIAGGEDAADSSPSLPPAVFLKEAIFAAGSFWELEAAFCRSDDGPVRTAAGYFGGSVPKPSYKEVVEGGTGYTEAVKVTYDRRKTTYKSLCKLFFESHDPTNKEYLRFGASTHHRSAIFYATEEEKKQARESKVERQMKLNRRIVTRILPWNAENIFYLAESHNQKRYLQEKQLRVCESLRLRSAQHFADSLLACRLNGIFSFDEKAAAEKLTRFLATCQVPEATKLALEEILSRTSRERDPVIFLNQWEVF